MDFDLPEKVTRFVPSPVRRIGGRAVETLFKYAKRVPLLRDRIAARKRQKAERTD